MKKNYILLMLLLVCSKLAFAGDWFVAGSFTNWDAGKLAMYNQSKASRLVLIPSAGNYLYKFISDNGTWTSDPNRSFTTSVPNTLAFFETPYNVNDLTCIAGGKVYVLGNLGDNNNSWSLAPQKEMTFNTSTNKFYYTAKLGGVGSVNDNTRFKAVYAKDADIRWEAIMSADKNIDITTQGVYVLETPLVKAYQDPQAVCSKVTAYAFYYGDNVKASFVPSSTDAALFTAAVDMTSENLTETNFYVGIEHAYAPKSIVGVSAVKKLSSLAGVSNSSVTLYTNSVSDFSENLGVQVAVPYIADASKMAPTKSFYASEVSFSETFVDNAKWHALSFPYDVVSVKVTLAGESSPRELKPGVDFWLKSYNGKGIWQNATSLNADGTGISAGAYIMAVPTSLKNLAITFTTKGGAVLTDGKIEKLTPAADKAVLINNPYPYSVNASSLINSGVIYQLDKANQRFDLVTDYVVKPFESIMAWNVSSPSKIAPRSISLAPSFLSTAIDKQILDQEPSVLVVNNSLVINGFWGNVAVYNMAGELIDSYDVNGEMTKTFVSGLYVVHVGNKIEKVIIK